MPQIFSRHNAGGSSLRTMRQGLVPVSIELSPGRPGIVKFSDGTTSLTSCLHCPEAPCMSFDGTEVVSASITEFPADRNPSTCPAGAMTRVNGGAPAINPDACMLCGVCASRCPVGAIRMVPYAVVDDTQRDAFPETDDGEATERSLVAFSAVHRSGDLLVESNAVVDDLRAKLLVAWNRVGDRFPDHLARNLLIAGGVGAAMRRKGDVAARMDIVLGAPWPLFGCVEVEFGDVAVLDAPRDILDDIAVSIGRHGKDPTSLVAFVITDVLPNWRSEYWRIIQDIRNVLGVRIGTITVLALCLLVWRGKKLADLSPNLFHVDVETESYRKAVLEPLLGREIKIDEAARPSVEVVK